MDIAEKLEEENRKLKEMVNDLLPQQKRHGLILSIIVLDCLSHTVTQKK